MICECKSKFEGYLIGDFLLECFQIGCTYSYIIFENKWIVEYYKTSKNYRSNIDNMMEFDEVDFNKNFKLVEELRDEKLNNFFNL